MEKHFLRAEVTKKEGSKISFVASDETLDRANDVIPIDSWDLNNYLKSPVLLVDHEYKVEKIVGLAENLSTTSGKLTFDAVFHDVTELARNVKQMVLDGVIKAVSVGFLPHAADKDGGRTRNELLEISIVAVGANPNALVQLNSLAKGITASEKKNVQEWLKKQIETLELQRMEFSKDQFKSVEEVQSWLTDNQYKKAEVQDIEGSYIVKNFDQDKCAEGSMKEIQVDEGIKFFACRLGNRDTVHDKSISDAEVKEGRVLSGRNRKQIQDTVQTLEQAKSALVGLLEATEKDATKETGDKSRKTEVEHEIKEPSKKAPLSVVRVLQSANKQTNALLRELKQ